MRCKECSHILNENSWVCPNCNSRLEGGIVVVSGITGTKSSEYLERVVVEAESLGYKAILHNVGQEIIRNAKEINPSTNWDMILDADPIMQNMLRSMVYKEIADSVNTNPDYVHFIDTHFCFRWKSYLVKGCEPHHFNPFIPYIRCFINLVGNLTDIKNSIAGTEWGKRNLDFRDILYWRDEELILSDIYADMCDRVPSYTFSISEPTSVMVNLIWKPNIPKVYFSFPIRGIKDNPAAREKINAFREKLRGVATVFDPFTIRDYDQVKDHEELQEIEKAVGETTELRDFRLIDQSAATVAFFPIAVNSDGVNEEMKHAIKTGKIVFLYRPESPQNGPFRVSPSYHSTNEEEFLELIRTNLN